jgi:hypothetical protein
MTGAFFFGILVGACAVLILTGLALYLVEIRAAWREGSELSGEEFERNRKREEE